MMKSTTWLKQHWPWVLSAAVITGSVVALLKARDISAAAQMGGFLAAVVSALALIWLIAAFFQQNNELRLQRQELSLQRKSLDLQRDELQRIGKHAALGQIATMLGNFKEHVMSLQLPGVSSLDDLTGYFMSGMQGWKTILESGDDGAVFEAYTEWAKVEALAVQFISNVAIAARLYDEATGEGNFKPAPDEASFIHFNLERLRSIPHIQQYAGAIGGLATNIFYLGPGLKKVRLAGLTSMNRYMPGTVKEEGLEALRREIEEEDRKRGR